MPLYDYKCEKCGQVYELEHGVNEAPPRKRCPGCRGALTKMFSPVGIVFKGSGFYLTDNRKNNGGNGTAKKPAGKKTGTAASETKTETKTETGGESKPAPAADAG